MGQMVPTDFEHWLDVREFEYRQELGIFLFINASRLAFKPIQPPIQCVPGALSLGVKWLRREADHSPPSSAEIKYACNYTSNSLNAPP
jgi:hypothetical protein